jgi:cobalt-precorrin 5A hydrolase
MFSKGIAVVAITKNGFETALKIRNALTKLNLFCKVYVPAKYVQGDAVAFDSKLEVFIKDTYPIVSAIVAVMETGIIIRAVAPHLENKLVDPAVVGVDASGKFVISLLSGYYGGANELTTLIAQGIGATPVVTTASDVMGKHSVDDLARILHLEIANPESRVALNAAIVNGDRVALVLIGDVNVPTEQVMGYEIKKAENAEHAMQIVNNYDAGAIVTQSALPMVQFTKPVAILKKQRLTIGICARKEISPDQILRVVTTVLKTEKVPLECIVGVATVDINQDSQSMINAAMGLGFNLKFVSIDQLRAFKHDDLSPDSKVVQEPIGVGGVCERVALIMAGKNPRLILKKMKLNGVILAIAAGE